MQIVMTMISFSTTHQPHQWSNKVFHFEHHVGKHLSKMDLLAAILNRI